MICISFNVDLGEPHDRVKLMVLLQEYWFSYTVYHCLLNKFLIDQLIEGAGFTLVRLVEVILGCLLRNILLVKVKIIYDYYATKRVTTVFMAKNILV